MASVITFQLLNATGSTTVGCITSRPEEDAPCHGYGLQLIAVAEVAGALHEEDRVSDQKFM